jgi:hypothetical protein
MGEFLSPACPRKAIPVSGSSGTLLTRVSVLERKIEFDRRGFWKVLGRAFATRIPGICAVHPGGSHVAQILVINHVFSTRFACIRLSSLNVMPFPWARGRRSR